MSKNNGLILRGDTWHMRFTLRGVLVAETTSTGNRREAELMVAKRKAEILNQAMLGKLKTIKLHAAIDNYIKSKQHLASHRSRDTNLSYFKSISDRLLNHVTPSDAQQVVSARFASGAKASTVSNAVTYFNAMVHYYAQMDYQVCKKIEKIKGIKGRVRWLTDDEEAAFFAALNPSAINRNTNTKLYKERLVNYELAIALRHTGARLSEISNMQWNQVDLAKGEIHIKRGKGSNDSTIHMSRMLQQIMQRRRDEDSGDFVFPTKVGVQPNNVWVERAVKRAKINTTNGSVSLHTLRHTAAVKWLQGGLNLLEVKEMLGHRSIQSTMVYLNLVPGNAARKGAAILDAMYTEEIEE